MSFRIAQKAALKSPFKQHRVGAVITKGGRILSTGFNEIRYNSVSKKPTMHAEAAAIYKLLKHGKLADLAGSTMYVTRFTKGGSVSCACPCDACSTLIRNVGIGRVIYTDFDGSTKEMKL